MDTKTTVLNMKEFVESKSGHTTMIGTDETTIKIQVESLAMHGKTMLMMYDATQDEKYLKQARLDYYRAKSLLRSGFIRPLGVIINEVA